MANTKISDLADVVTLAADDLTNVIDVSEASPSDQPKKATMTEIAAFIFSGSMVVGVPYVSCTTGGGATAGEVQLGLASGMATEDGTNDEENWEAAQA
jgi:hypothetical protein